MSDITIMGGSICGLLAALLLAEDSHQVTVLERDPAAPPDDAEEAWTNWERRSVRQFRLGHLFLAGFRDVLERELPQVADAIEGTGALRFNVIEGIPDEATGGWRDDDVRFEVLTGRRPVVESAIARVAEEHGGIDVRRGVLIDGLLTERRDYGDHLLGVRSADDNSFTADLLVDATGRQSPLPRLLAAAGCATPVEEAEDSGFVYYGRTFRSADGSIPFAFGPLLQHYESLSILTLPADNGTWFVGLVAAAGDAAMRAVRDNETWTRLVRAYPLVAHWLDAEPITDVIAMGKLEDRIRNYVVDGAPIVTGLAALADAWACTNPSLGRGSTMGLLHAVALRDQLREDPTDDPVRWSLGWAERTEANLEPWYRDTLRIDRHRLAEIDAEIAGVRYETDDPSFALSTAMGAAAMKDPDVLRANLDTALMLRTFDDVVADEGFVERIMELAGDDEAPPGPTRKELTELLER